jgi:hypothetical protein
MNEFILAATSDQIWNRVELINFLSKNQKKHIAIRMNPEAICFDNLGLYDLLDCFDFAQVNLYTENPLESHKKYNIIINNYGPWLRKKEIIDEKLHNWNNKKIFFCLFGRPTASRLGIAAHLYGNYNLISHLHFSANLTDDELIQFELDKLLQYHLPSIKPAGELINNLPLLLSAPNRYTAFNGYYYDDPLTNFYQDILIDVVVESHVSGNTFYPTEKTTRPMWLKKPFIMFASKDYLCYLRQSGFRTFSDFWDEDYDAYEGRERYVKILQLIDNLAKKSTVELEKMYWDMQYTLDYNYNLLQTQSYNVNNIEKII